jgi:hypothetical protein
MARKIDRCKTLVMFGQIGGEFLDDGKSKVANMPKSPMLQVLQTDTEETNSLSFSRVSDRVGPLSFALNNEKVDKESYVYLRVRRSRPLTNPVAGVTFPTITLAPWGGNWSKDIVSLMHNAIMREISDLFDLASTMQRRKFSLTQHHVKMFYKWFDEFHSFAETCLSVESTFLVPWITKNEKFKLGGVVRESQRMVHCGSFRHSLSRIADYRYKFNPSLPVGERLDGLLVLVSNLAAVPEYYAAAHTIVPCFIELHHRWTPWTKIAVHRKIVLKIRLSEDFRRNLVLLTRWMGENDSKHWCKGMLRRPADMVLYGRWRQDILHGHCALAKSFDSVIQANNDGAGIKRGGIGSSMAIYNCQYLDRSRISLLNPGFPLPVVDVDWADSQAQFRFRDETA